MAALDLSPIVIKNVIDVTKAENIVYYERLAQDYILFNNEAHLSGSGEAIEKTVTIAGIMKKKGVAVEKKIETSTAMIFDETKGKMVEVGKIDILLGRGGNFEVVMADTIEILEIIRKLWDTDPTNELNASCEADDSINATQVLEENIGTREQGGVLTAATAAPESYDIANTTAALEADDLITAATSAHLMTASIAELDDLMAAADGAHLMTDAIAQVDDMMTDANGAPEAAEEDNKE